MRSTVTLLGHVGLDVRLGSSRVVCDPWLSTRGAYLGGWHQFPDNSRLAAADLHETPVLFIGSPRPDHLDVETLRAFPKTVQVVVPALPTRRLVEQLQQLGFGSVIELADWQPFDLGGGAQLTVVASSTKHLLAAAAIVELDGQVVVNQNDCVLSGEALARLAAKQPALHVVQFSGPSYFPIAYDFSPDQMAAEAEKEMAQRSAVFYDAVAGVAARYVVPTGGPCFLDDRSFQANAGENLLPDADELLAKTARERPELAERMRPLYPGDVATAEGADWQFAGRRPYEDKQRHLEAQRRTRRPLADGLLDELRASATPVEIKELRSHLRDLFQFEDMTWDLGLLIQVCLHDGPSMWIDFRKKPYRFLTESEEAASHAVTVDSAWLSLVLQEKLSWHDLLMAGLVSVHRGSQSGSEKLMAHFDFRHDGALFDLVRWRNPALIIVQDEKMEYVCQRFCPHRGRDLEYAIIERGVLTCTAHGWRFDLRKGGKCLWGGEAPLLVTEIRPLKG